MSLSFYDDKEGCMVVNSGILTDYAVEDLANRIPPKCTLVFMHQYKNAMTDPRTAFTKLANKVDEIRDFTTSFPFLIVGAHPKTKTWVGSIQDRVWENARLAAMESYHIRCLTFALPDKEIAKAVVKYWQRCGIYGFTGINTVAMFINRDALAQFLTLAEMSLHPSKFRWTKAWQSGVKERVFSFMVTT